MELLQIYMAAHGLLTENGVLIEKPQDASRLQGKSQYGTPQSNNRLLLDFIEAAYLILEQKVIIKDSQQNILTYPKIIHHAISKYPSFDSNFLVYRDLRKRGYTIKNQLTQDITFYQKPKNKHDHLRYITVFTEHNEFAIAKTKQLITQANQKNATLWYAIVDEEGDLTYYDINLFTPTGVIPKKTYPKIDALLVENRVLLFEKNIMKKLHESEFYGKPFGTGLQLSIIEALHLQEHKVIEILSKDNKKLTKTQILKKYQKIDPHLKLKLNVYKDLKKRGLIVKTGFKYGAHFRGYTKKPDKTHAEYLIHVVPADYKQRWAEISRAIRLAHSVNKEILFAQVDDKSVDYVKLGRLRP